MRRGLGAPGECGVRGKEPRWKDEVHLTAGRVCVCAHAHACVTLLEGRNATLRGPSGKECGALGDHKEGRVADTGKGTGTGKREETKGGWGWTPQSVEA